MSPAVDHPHIRGGASCLVGEGPQWSVFFVHRHLLLHSISIVACTALICGSLSLHFSVVMAGVALLSTFLHTWTLLVSQRDLKGQQGLESNLEQNGPIGAEVTALSPQMRIEPFGDLRTFVFQEHNIRKPA